jgi:hypothetical protein
LKARDRGAEARLENRQFVDKSGLHEISFFRSTDKPSSTIFGKTATGRTSATTDRKETDSQMAPQAAEIAQNGLAASGCGIGGRRQEKVAQRSM